MLKLGWFSTGRGEGSQGLLTTVVDAIREKDLDAEILFVFCNKESGEHPGSDHFMDMVRQYEIPLVTFSSQEFRKKQKAPSISMVREAYDREVMDRLSHYSPDICVLAGHMLIVGHEMCKKYIMLNLHPALPDGPMGTWENVIWSIIETRASEHGAMIHLATEELDQGPALSYASFPLRGKMFDSLWNEITGQSVTSLREKYGSGLPLFQMIRRQGLNLEQPLLLETLKSFSGGKLMVSGGVIVNSSGNVESALCLNSLIETYDGNGSEQ